MRDQFLQSVSVAFATWQHIFVFLFAAAVILLFAGDRYNRPTYTRERDGFVALIAPRFLTSDSRYAQGLRIYAAIILGFYVFLVFAGKKVAEALLPSGPHRIRHLLVAAGRLREDGDAGRRGDEQRAGGRPG